MTYAPAPSRPLLLGIFVYAAGEEIAARLRPPRSYGEGLQPIDSHSSAGSSLGSAASAIGENRRQSGPQKTTGAPWRLLTGVLFLYQSTVPPERLESEVKRCSPTEYKPDDDLPSISNT